jgi:hypothetical protein
VFLGRLSQPAAEKPVRRPRAIFLLATLANF